MWTKEDLVPHDTRCGIFILNFGNGLSLIDFSTGRNNALMLVFFVGFVVVREC